MSINKQNLLESFITFCFLSLIVVLYIAGYNYGFTRGAESGYIVAIDTVDSILVKYIEGNDVNKVTLVGKSDTNVYYISNKIITK